MKLNLGQYYVEAHLHARHPWSRLKLDRREGVQHLVWGEFSFFVEHMRRNDKLKGKDCEGAVGVCNECRDYTLVTQPCGDGGVYFEGNRISS